MVLHRRRSKLSNVLCFLNTPNFPLPCSTQDVVGWRFLSLSPWDISTKHYLIPCTEQRHGGQTTVSIPLSQQGWRDVPKCVFCLCHCHSYSVGKIWPSFTEFCVFLVDYMNGNALISIEQKWKDIALIGWYFNSLLKYSNELSEKAIYQLFFLEYKKNNFSCSFEELQLKAPY